jgi:hypothetical protein
VAQAHENRDWRGDPLNLPDSVQSRREGESNPPLSASHSSNLLISKQKEA